MSRNKIDRTGETNISNEGCSIKIVEYNNARDITVEFQDGYKYRLHTRYEYFKNGKCKNPYYPSVYGHGYLGVDRNGNVPKTKEFKDGKYVTTWEANKWGNMLQDALIINTKRKIQLIKMLPVVIDGYVLLIF